MSFHAADVVSSANLFLLLGRIACTECKDVAYCYHRGMVCLPTCVCLLDTTLNHTKTAEPIDVSFGLWTRVGQSNHVFCGVRIPQEKGQFVSAPCDAAFCHSVILLPHRAAGQATDSDERVVRRTWWLLLVSDRRECRPDGNRAVPSRATTPFSLDTRAGDAWV